MADNLIKDAKKVLAGKTSRLEDQELEYLAREITKLGFKLGFARAYAAGPDLVAKLLRRIEHQEKQINGIRKVLGVKW